MLKRHAVAASLLLIGMSGSLPLFAASGDQDTGAAAGPAEIQEIIVTARKREESILDVPVIEVAVPAQQLERIQTVDLHDVATLVPGLILGDSAQSVGTQVSIRGVGTSTLDTGIDQSVALNLDGLQLTQGLAYESAIFDVSQVEVLKGPQALFYGKNSPGGVISVRSADPTDKVEVIARYGREFVADENRAELILSGPVNDQLKLRLAGAWDKSDGYFDQTGVAAPGLGGLTPPNSTGPVDENYIIRGTVLWNPIDALTSRLKINVTHDRSLESGKEQLASCPDGTGPVPGFGIPFLGGDDCKLNRSVGVVDLNPAAFPLTVNGGVPVFTIDQRFGSLELNYDLPQKIALNSTTGYYDIAALGYGEGTHSTDAGSAVGTSNNFHRRDWTEELRANSNFSGPVNFTAGGFLQHADMFTAVGVLGNTALQLPPLLIAGSNDVPIRSYSGFGQLRWDIISAVELSAGARYTAETRHDIPYNTITGTSVFIDNPGQTEHYDNLSPEATVTYKPTDSITAFGSWKKGFKSGSYNTTLPPTPGVANGYGPETVKGEEAGLKTRWLDHRLALNAAIYRYKYQGLQVGAVEPVEGLPTTETVNAAGALVYGVDLDGSYRPALVEGLDIFGSIEWNHARYTSFDDAPCWAGQTIAAGCNQALDIGTGLYSGQDLSGVPLVRAPDTQAAFGASYEKPLSDQLSIALSSDNQYSSRYLTTLGTRSDFYEKWFIKTDFSATIKGSHDRWEISVIGKNLGDVVTTSHCDAANFRNGTIFGGVTTGGLTSGPAGPAQLACFADRGREVWLRVTVKPFH